MSKCSLRNSCLSLIRYNSSISISIFHARVRRCSFVHCAYRKPEFPCTTLQRDGCAVSGTAAQKLTLFYCLPALYPEFLREPKRLPKDSIHRRVSMLIVRLIQHTSICLSWSLARDSLPDLRTLTKKVQGKLVGLGCGTPKVHYFGHIPLMIERSVYVWC